jgi:triosephosphate isomerase (TIM)
MRKPIIAGNWKLQNTIPAALELVRALKTSVGMVQDVEVIVAPVFTAVHAVAGEVNGTAIRVAAQDCYWEESGAYTGEVAPGMLKDAGCSHVIIGHSERRQYFGETDATVNKKVTAAMAAGLTPIVCVGESLAQREAGSFKQVVEEQVRAGLSGLSAAQIAGLVIAYEPVWAIGTGKTATPEQAQEVHALIRNQLADIASPEVAAGLRILYGGSVNPGNVDDLMRRPDLDGALVGGASLKADSFTRLVQFQK